MLFFGSDIDNVVSGLDCRAGYGRIGRNGTVGGIAVVNDSVFFARFKIKPKAAVGDIPLAHIVVRAVEEHLVIKLDLDIPDRYVIDIIIIGLDYKRVGICGKQTVVVIVTVSVFVVIIHPPGIAAGGINDDGVIDIIAVVTALDGLEAHIEREQSRLGQGKGDLLRIPVLIIALVIITPVQIEIDRCIAG